MVELNKNLKIKKRVEITIKGKETSSKLASYTADYTTKIPAK